MKSIGSKVMKNIRYELKSLNRFAKRPLTTPLDKTWVPVIIKIFSYDYKKTNIEKVTKNLRENGVEAIMT